MSVMSSVTTQAAVHPSSTSVGVGKYITEINALLLHPPSELALSFFVSPCTVLCDFFVFLCSLLVCQTLHITTITLSCLSICPHTQILLFLFPQGESMRTAVSSPLFLWLLVFQEYILKVFAKGVCVSFTKVSNCGDPQSSQLSPATTDVGRWEVMNSASGFRRLKYLI